MIAAVTFFINQLLIIANIIAMVTTLLGVQNYNITFLLLMLLILMINTISLKKQNKEYTYLELNYFTLIKQNSKYIKDDDMENLYFSLRKIRRTNWYKNFEKCTNKYKSNFLIDYGDDEYLIDYYEEIENDTKLENYRNELKEINEIEKHRCLNRAELLNKERIINMIRLLEK